MQKSTCLLLALFLTLSLNLVGNEPSKAHAGDYVGTLAFTFLSAGASDGPLMQCETTYVGGQAFSMGCLVGGVEGHQSGLATCTGQFSAAGLNFYCSMLLKRTGVDETDIFHFNALLEFETQEGEYISTSLGSVGGSVVAETLRGTVRLIPPFM